MWTHTTIIAYRIRNSIISVTPYFQLYCFLEECFNSQCISGGTVATGNAQSKALWAIREHVPITGNKKPGYSLKFDISISLENFPILLEAVRNEANALGMNATVLGYGMRLKYFLLFMIVLAVNPIVLMFSCHMADGMRMCQ